jgi:hypothetical protein
VATGTGGRSFESQNADLTTTTSVPMMEPGSRAVRRKVRPGSLNLLSSKFEVSLMRETEERIW